MSTGKMAIVGVGNPDRGDDAVGRRVAEQLRGRALKGVETYEIRGEMTELLDLLESVGAAYLVDAAASGAVPGTIRRFDVHDGPLPQSVCSLSSHGFGVAQAIEMARAMGTLPVTCVVFAVEGENFEAGEGLSPRVEKAGEKVVELLLTELAGWNRGEAYA